jgi:glycine hydroxymethyltransferase
MSSLQQVDPQVFAALEHEKKRQKEGIELIPSENYVSAAVLEAIGTIFTNKYSEGYPGRRYYGGQENTDIIESLAIERAKQLFRADHANVQPLSGAPANLAAYSALLEPGDTVLGMDLSHGGHLTHGHPVTHSAKIYKFVRYKTKGEQADIDFDELREVALREKPKVILCGYSAYPRELDYAKFKQIADEVGAITMADIAHIAGLIAADKMKNPFDYGFDIVTSTTHKTLRGPRGGMILCREQYAKQIDKAVFPGLQGGPHMNHVAAKAVAFEEALQPEFKIYAEQILKNAKVMAQKVQELGLKLYTHGTENHLMMGNVMESFGIPGKQAQETLDKVGITLNMNMLPDDPRSALDPSGIRFGTPAITTRGMKEAEMEKIAELMIAALKSHQDESRLTEIHQEIKNLCSKFPVPGIS